MTWLSSTPWFFQSPWALFALSSLVVPLAIHLFSKSKGTLIPFGNIKLIELTKPIRMNQIRLVERLLLLCRLMVLILSVLILSQLYYDGRTDNNTNSEGNIVVTKDWLNNADDSELNYLAIQSQQSTVYLLSKINERLTTDKIINWKKIINTTAIIEQQQNTWLLVNNYAKTLPENIKIIVYSTNRLSQFVGEKLGFPANVTWKIKKLPLNEIKDSANALKSQSVSVLILSDKDSNEAIGYLNAALSILKESKLENLTFTFQSKQNTPLESFDWVFYLSTESPPSAVLNAITKGTKVIVDVVHTNIENVTATIDWNKQVKLRQFPQVLMSILLNESIKIHQMQQQLTNEQIESHQINNIEINSRSLVHSQQFKNPWVDKLLIILLVIFWSIERVLSESNKVKSKILKNHGSDTIISHKHRDK